MGLSILEFILICVGVFLCYRGIYRCGKSAGYEEGIEAGYTAMLKDLCDGNVVIDGRKILFKKSMLRLLNPSTHEVVDELDMDELEFQEY